jgi:hypothetical protein
MSEKHEIDKRIEETMESLNGIRRAEANPFLYTRVQARLNQSRSVLEQVVMFAGRPAFAFLVMLIVLATNLTVMLKGAADTSTAKQEQPQSAMVEEYHLAVASLYDYETP